MDVLAHSLKAGRATPTSLPARECRALQRIRSRPRALWVGILALVALGGLGWFVYVSAGKGRRAIGPPALPPQHRFFTHPMS